MRYKRPDFLEAFGNIFETKAVITSPFRQVKEDLPGGMSPLLGAAWAQPQGFPSFF